MVSCTTLQKYYAPARKIPSWFVFDETMDIGSENENWLERARLYWQQCFTEGETIVTLTDYVRGDIRVWSENTMVPVKEKSRVKRIIVTMIEKAGPQEEQPSFVIVCAWCNAYVRSLGSSKWRPVNEMFRDLGFDVSHGICEKCANSRVS